jgi:hypothetical protein
MVGGRPLNPDKYLRLHEEIEHDRMTRLGETYAQAHKVALAEERKAVKADGFDWDAYQRVMYRLAAQTQAAKVTHPPKDLYLGPYSPQRQPGNRSRIRRPRTCASVCPGSASSTASTFLRTEDGVEVR